MSPAGWSCGVCLVAAEGRSVETIWGIVVAMTEVGYEQKIGGMFCWLMPVNVCARPMFSFRVLC